MMNLNLCAMKLCLESTGENCLVIIKLLIKFSSEIKVNYIKDIKKKEFSHFKFYVCENFFTMIISSFICVRS